MRTSGEGVVVYSRRPDEGQQRATQTEFLGPAGESSPRPTPRERAPSPRDTARPRPCRLHPEPLVEHPPRRGPYGVGCWNCSSPRHLYAECPLPRAGSFCYGCGQQGVTLRGCELCGGVYRRTAPYTANGALGRPDPHRQRGTTHLCQTDGRGRGM